MFAEEFPECQEDSGEKGFSVSAQQKKKQVYDDKKKSQKNESI